MQIWFQCITNSYIRQHMLTRDAGHPTPTHRLLLQSYHTWVPAQCLRCGMTVAI